MAERKTTNDELETKETKPKTHDEKPKAPTHTEIPHHGVQVGVEVPNE